MSGKRSDFDGFGDIQINLFFKIYFFLGTIILKSSVFFYIDNWV